MTGDLQASSKVRQGLEQVLAPHRRVSYTGKWPDDGQPSFWWQCSCGERLGTTAHQTVAEGLHAAHQAQIALAWFAVLLDESREDACRLGREEDDAQYAGGSHHGATAGDVVDIAIAAIKQRAGMSS